jgi:hypothetical protein
MKIQLPNVRLSFPSLFTHGTFNGDSTGKFEATFILDEKDHADAIKMLRSEIKKLIKEDLKGSKLGADRVCLQMGDQDRPEYEGKFTIKTSTKKRPMLINRDKTPIVEEDGVLYAGCYVNAIVSLWAQNNGYGKRINGQLDGIQFVRDGDAFGDAGISSDAFDAFETPTFDGPEEDDDMAW